MTTEEQLTALTDERDRLREHVVELRQLVARVAASSAKVVEFSVHVLEKTKPEGFEDKNPQAIAELTSAAQRLEDIEARLEAVEGIVVP